MCVCAYVFLFRLSISDLVFCVYDWAELMRDKAAKSYTFQWRQRALLFCIQRTWDNIAPFINWPIACICGWFRRFDSRIRTTWARATMWLNVLRMTFWYWFTLLLLISHHTFEFGRFWSHHIATDVCYRLNINTKIHKYVNFNCEQLNPFAGVLFKPKNKKQIPIQNKSVRKLFAALPVIIGIMCGLDSTVFALIPDCCLLAEMALSISFVPWSIGTALSRVNCAGLNCDFSFVNGNPLFFVSDANVFGDDDDDGGDVVCGVIVAALR